MSRTKGGSIPKFTLPWMQMVCRSEYLLQRVPELIAKKLSIWSREYPPKHCWLIGVMIRTKSFPTPWPRDKGRHSSEAKSQRTTGIRPIFVSITPFGGKCFLASETLARNCHSIRQKYGFIPCCCSNSVHRYLVHHFGMISCRHCLRCNWIIFWNSCPKYVD